MDYDTLYGEYQDFEKALKDKLKSVAKLQKSIAKQMESGDVFRSLPIPPSSSVSKDVESLFSDMHALLDGFDAKEYSKRLLTSSCC